jgi:P4 family phage/plasmid primase-like protien
VTLNLTHRHELEQASAIDPAVIAEREYRTVERRDRGELADLGFSASALSSDQSFPGLLLPMFRATGERISAQFKPAKPITIRARSVKYLSPRSQCNCLDVHPRNRSRIADLSATLWITEGIKKGDSLTSRGCCVVTLTGVYNWRSKLATLGDWEDVPLRRRDVVLCFDADARRNMNVARAMVRLGRWCLSKGAKTVRYLIVPSEFNGKLTKGADDFFAVGGTLDVLEAAATTTEPNTETADDTFSDARLAETIADEVLGDRFLWCKALGWLGWSGQRWTSVTEEAVGEAVRQYVLRRFGQAVTVGKRDAVHGWQPMLGVGRLRAVLSLARGIVERTADVFDADPDVLNTPGGVVDLRTGQIQPHDPDFLITKITSGAYRPGQTHPDWEQALTALPEEVRAWFQVRVGQAITGHPTPDGVIPILQGGGENGKSALTTDGIVPALGDYADVVGPKLIASAKDEHSTERADLRGQRFLIAEELTEDRALNITAIKQITDVGRIKARYVFRDNFTFAASHSLFVTTNYVPVVNETDHGTWRRLALVTFPFTFRKPREALTGPTDRRGDPGLKARLRTGAGQHDAIVTWVVEGARRCYQSGVPALPGTVEADTRAWRTQADRILGFWDECLRPDDEACILTTDLLQVFNAWLKSNGHREWSKELFHPRFRSHVETVRHHVEERRTMKLDGLSRPFGAPPQGLPKQALVYLGVCFRALGDIDENIRKNSEVAEVADPPGTSTREASVEEVPDGSATSASDHSERPTEEAQEWLEL